jgi:hypothetical protein
MAEDPDERFDILFAGECLDGHSPAAVRAALAGLFGRDEASIERLFSGARQVIKRGCDRATALNYQRAMTQAGARPIITRAPAAAAARARPASGLTLAEPGSDVLRPEERRAVAPVVVDTSHLRLDEAGALLVDAAPPLPTLDAPDYGLAEPGSRLDERPAPAATVVETGGLGLVEGELDLRDCAPAAAREPSLNLDHLALAAAGSDLRAGSESPVPPAPPRTDHLHLLPADDDAAP